MFTPLLPIHNILVQWDNNLPLVDAVTGEKIPNTTFNTSFMGIMKIKGVMREDEIFLGMPIRPRFNETPKGRNGDLWFEPDFAKDFTQKSVKDQNRGM